MKRSFVRENATGVPGVPSRYFRELTAGDKPQRAVVVARVSGRPQRKHLGGQISSIRDAAGQHGVKILRVIKVVAGANSLEFGCKLREVLTYAAQHDAGILAESTSRLIRNPRFNPANGQKPGPTERGFEELMRTVGECGAPPIYTVHHPDLEPNEETSCQARRGKRYAHDPWEPVWTRDEVMESAYEIWSRGNTSYRRLGRMFGRSHMTIVKWVKAMKERDNSGVNFFVNRQVPRRPGMPRISAGKATNEAA